MSRVMRNTLLYLAVIILSTEGLFAQRNLLKAAPSSPTTSGFVYGPPLPLPFFGGFGGYGGYGGYGFPSYGYSGYGAPFTYAPNYWWVSPYPIADPRQDGYNPSAGYEWDSVGTLILDTFPAKVRVTLDGMFVGTADKLGPFQLPAGEHTLRFEASGYETYETVVRFEQPGLQELDIRLKPLTAKSKPAPAP